MATTSQLTEEGTSKFVQAGKHQVHLNEAGTGHAVILLHGGGLGATGWSNFVRNIGPLSEHYRVLLVDQVGYGKTDDEVFTTESSSTARARSIRDTMDALSIDEATLIGNSMGGSTTLAFAVDYPDRLHKMVLMGSGAGGASIFTHTPTEGMKVLGAMFDGPSTEKLRALFQVMLYDSSFVSEELLQQRFDGIMANPGHLEARNNSTNIPRDVMPDLLDVKTPTLIVHGRNDRVVPLEGSMRLLSTLENSRLVVLNHCGHWAQFEHADLFNRMVTDFVDND
jgi:pimeloyl-ACP methyl ester carboxylesterase